MADRPIPARSEVPEESTWNLRDVFESDEAWQAEYEAFKAVPEQIEAFRTYVEGKGLTFVPISAATMQGVRELPGLVYNRLKDIPPVPVFTPEYKKPEAKKNGRDFTIQRMEAHVWSVDAPWLEYILAGSNVDDYESLQFFQRQLGESGILDALVQKGVEENDTILIGEYQFDYIF